MSETADVIVLGLGGFGGGALFHLADRGVRVVGIEQFDIGHDRGSSHGETRIIRKAYFEHPDYVPLLERAYELWQALEARSGRELFRPCGLMLAGRPETEAIAGARLSAEKYGLSLERLSVEEARRRFPGFLFSDDFEIVYESAAGYLRVERCVRAHIEQAIRRGATVKKGETVRNWQVRGSTVRVETDRSVYEADRLVITAGAWSAQVLADLDLPLTIVRKPLFWCPLRTPMGAHPAPECAFLYDLPEGQFYGFPPIDQRTVKLAEHTGGCTVSDPSDVDRRIHAGDLDPVTTFVRRFLIGVEPEPERHSVCLYTRTPDGHFVVDVHPQFAQVVLAAGFSGHGFKFTGVLGEALADLALTGRTDLPIRFLSLTRFRNR